jgi:glycosyltransferase involved in cell wall biosynthesis
LRCPDKMSWVCCQLGAREHYAIPRALFRQGSLDHLLTDAWAPPTSILRIVGDNRSQIRDRWHEELKETTVTSFNWSLIAFEFFAQARRLHGWPLIIARNRWFQQKVVDCLSGYKPRTDNRKPIVFGYSYAAREIFHFAKSRGWKTVLGQIDPGPFEEKIVVAEAERQASLAPSWTRAPAQYWESWREECDLADWIIVNSQWSLDALIRTGIRNEKLSIIPLAFENSASSVSPKEYPSQFTATRPLRVLFLGQINLRKGIARLLKAAQLIQSQPIEFLMVGPIQIRIPQDLRSNRKIRWTGPVSRKRVRDYYNQADVFILPTLSDGFGLTQLEALAHRLPVIASRRCGGVVIDGVNGLLLEEPTAEAIDEALQFCLNNPDQLAQFSENATVNERFSLSYLGTMLSAIAV